MIDDTDSLADVDIKGAGSLEVLLCLGLPSGSRFTPDFDANTRHFALLQDVVVAGVEHLYITTRVCDDNSGMRST